MKRHATKRMTPVMAALLVLCLLLGTLSTAFAEEETYRDQIVIANREMISSCSYLNQSGGLPYCLTNDTLLYVDDNGEYQPNICDSFEFNEDGTMLTIHLPEDLYFHDGTNVTANDWKRSFEFGMENSSMAGSWEGITSVEADGYDIIIHMDNGYSASIPFQLSSVMMPIVCAEDIDNLSIDELYWNARIYGSYYVDEFVQGDHVTLKANPYYKTNNPNIENQGKPYVDTVVIRFMTDNFAIVQGLLAGEIDIANSYLTVENLPELNAADNLVVTVAKNAGIYSFIINPKNELFADENVRKALALLIDRDMLYEQSEETLFPAYNLVSDFSIGYSEAFTEWYKENFTSENGTEEALALLAEAGWTDSDGDGLLDKDGQIFEFTLSEFSHDNMLLNLLQIQLMEAGIMMNIEPLTTSTDFRRMLSTDDWDVGLASNSFAEISSILSGHLEQVELAGLLPEEEFEEIYALFEKAQSCLDSEEAEGYYNEVLKAVVGDAYYIPISTPAIIVVYNKDIYDGVYYREDATKIWLNDCK